MEEVRGGVLVRVNCLNYSLTTLLPNDNIIRLKSAAPT